MVQKNVASTVIAARGFIVLVVLGGLLLPAQGAASSDVRIGVLAFRGSQDCLSRWEPTARQLNKAVTGYNFRIVPLSLDRMGEAVEREHVDFVLTNTGNYVELEAKFGISRIATLKTPDSVAAGNVFGAVIFTRADRRDIRTLKDLKGKRFMAVKPRGFGGFQMAWREFKDDGIDPFDDFSELRFSGFPQDRVAMAVRDGEVDAGTFRTGSLEVLAAEGKIKLSDFRILNEKTYPDFPLAVSTRLYPEWPFSKLRSTSADLAQKVAVALLRTPADGPAARAGGYGGWTVPLDYQAVHDLFRELRIGPYEDLGDITIADMLEQYGVWILVTVLVLIMTASWAVWTEFLVTRRTQELVEANSELERQAVERKRIEEVAYERQAELAHVARLNTMGEMASGLAHELNHPLATITNYAKGGIRRLRSGEGDSAQLLEALQHIAGQADRAAGLIRSVRDFVRKDKGRRRCADINGIIRDVAGLLYFDVENGRVALELDLTEPLPPVCVDVVQIEQAILNLSRNAVEAMREIPPGRRNLRIATSKCEDGMVEVAVKDTGMGIPAQVMDKLFSPFMTMTPGGLGLGLSISHSIIELHGGRIWVESSCEDGADIRFTLPLVA